MINNVISLRQFIDRSEEFENVKIQTFCRLMKKVSEAIDKEERDIIRINLDEIKINTDTGEIVFPENLFSGSIDMTKTVAGINTGISLMADRKSSKEHKRVSLALMMLGWYANEDRSSVINDLEVLENFDHYMNKVPMWLRDFFVGVFRRMDYDTTFSDYYKKNFTDRIKSDIYDAFSEYNLPKEQMDNIMKVILLKADNMIVGGGTSEE